MVTLDLGVYPGKLHQNAIYGAKNFTTPELFCQALFSTFFENIFPSQILIDAQARRRRNASIIETLQKVNRGELDWNASIFETFQVHLFKQRTCLNVLLFKQP